MPKLADPSLAERVAIPGWPALMSPKLAAAYLGFSVRWLEQRASAGDVAQVRVGSEPRYRRADLDQFIASLKRCN